MFQPSFLLRKGYLLSFLVYVLANTSLVDAQEASRKLKSTDRCPVAICLQGIEFGSTEGNQVKVEIQTSGISNVPPSFVTNAMPKVTIDFFDATVVLPKLRFAVGIGALEKIQVVQAYGRVRIVFGLEEMVDYTTEIDGDRLVVIFDSRAGNSPISDLSTSTSTFSVLSQSILEYRYFPSNSNDPEQDNGENWSLSIEPKFRYGWNGGKSLITFQPFIRLDQRDKERSHADIRELNWIQAFDNWELKAGIGKSFWGVTESTHLVDIINQTDLVENQSGESKLGQPMLNLTAFTNWGDLGFFVLPGFRERTFPGANGRPRTTLRIDTTQVEYESDKEDLHVDTAIRWSHTLSNFDVGLSYFSGTSREPRLVPRVSNNNEPVLVPIYDLIDQTGIDIQATLDAWLFKLEAIRRSGERQIDGTRARTWWATNLGFEYTFFSVLESAVDVSALVEYLHDSRGKPVLFEDDVYLGVRIAMNDTQTTEILLGGTYDTEGDARIYNLELSRRIRENWRLHIEARSLSKVPPSDPLFGGRNDEYLMFSLGHFY